MYDIHDDPAWLKINPPEAEVSSTFTESSASLVSGEHSSKRGCERVQNSTDIKAPLYICYECNAWLHSDLRFNADC